MRRKIGNRLIQICKTADHPMRIGEIAFVMGMDSKLMFIRNLAAQAIKYGFMQSTGIQQTRLYQAETDWEDRIQAHNEQPQKRKIQPKKRMTKTHVPNSIFNLGAFL